MSRLFNGSICLSDIPKEKITTSEKNGKKHLNFNLWVNDEKDQYGNIGSINVSQTKEERANLVYAVKIKVKNDGYLKIGMYGEVMLNAPTK